jgi:integrase
VPLTDTQCRAAQPRGKAYKLSDSRGLYLFVTPAGFKSWRWKYRVAGREKTLTLGSYPELKLTAARDARDDARRAHRQGLDPSQARQQEKEARAREAAATFETVARRWHKWRAPTWTPEHAANVLTFLQQALFPKLGSKPIAQITAPTVLEVLRSIEARSIDRANRLRGHISAIFVFAISEGLAETDPAASLNKALKPVRRRHYPALRTIEEARELLTAAEAAPGHPLTKLASRLLALTAVRSGPLRHAEWPEFQRLDSSEPIWRIPAGKMKLDLSQKEQEAFEFIVPLAPAAVEIVQLARRFSGNAPFLFPNGRDSRRPMSENALSIAYRRLPAFASRHVPHGWRSTFATIMNERAERQGRPGDRAVIDLMLAHKPSGVEAIYNRAAFMPRRRELAQEWAELLLEGLPPSSSLLDGTPRH